MYVTEIIARVKQYVSTFQMVDNDYGSRCYLNPLVFKIPTMSLNVIYFMRNSGIALLA